MPKRTLLLMLLLGATAAGWVVAGNSTPDEDDLPTLETLDVRPSMETPKLTLPNDLTVVPKIKPGEYHVPGRIENLEDTKYAAMVEYGRQLFVETQKYAKRYVGNSLNCSNCHLQEGRKPHAAPMWAAYPLYPMYRNKTRSVVTFQERMQDCFRYSLNGMAPTLDSLEIKALTAYAQFLSKDIPVGTLMPGRGFTRIDKSVDPSPFNGAIVYKQHCAFCHGEDMLGKKFTHREGYMFPPLTGGGAFNKAAGMFKVKTCASFVQANMPPGKPYTLTDDQALDVCVHMWLQERPWDPRKSWFKNLFMPVVEG